MTYLYQMATPVYIQAYDTIKYRSPATDATLHALGKRLFMAHLKLAEEDTIRILVTNFSYDLIFFTLTAKPVVGHVRVHIKPNSLISEIVEDIREQYKLKSTDAIFIYTVCQFLGSLPHQSLTVQLTDSISSLPR